jgi:hypothetical protein
MVNCLRIADFGEFQLNFLDYKDAAFVHEDLEFVHGCIPWKDELDLRDDHREKMVNFELLLFEVQTTHVPILHRRH